jgi:hypothetical protein
MYQSPITTILPHDNDLRETFLHSDKPVHVCLNQNRGQSVKGKQNKLTLSKNNKVWLRVLKTELLIKSCYAPG